MQHREAELSLWLSPSAGLYHVMEKSAGSWSPGYMYPGENSVFLSPGSINTEFSTRDDAGGSQKMIVVDCLQEEAWLHSPLCLVVSLSGVQP